MGQEEENVGEVCAGLCPATGTERIMSALPGWPAILETVIGREPLGRDLFGSTCAIAK